LIFGSVIRSDDNSLHYLKSQTKSLIVHSEDVVEIEVDEVCTELQESVSEIFAD